MISRAQRKFGAMSTATRVVVAGGVALVLAGGVTAAGAAITASDSTVINACVLTKDGSVRIIAAGKTCAKGETAVSWNQTGPAGPQGAPGAMGPAGPAGADGEDSTNAAGLSVYDGDTRLGPLTSASGTQIWYLSADGVVTSTARTIIKGEVWFAELGCRGAAFYMNDTQPVGVVIDVHGLVKYEVTSITKAPQEIASYRADFTNGECYRSDGPFTFDVQPVEVYVNRINIH